MKTYLQNLATAATAAALLVATIGCEEVQTEEPAPDVAKPQISNVECVEAETTQTTAVVSVDYVDADAVYYCYYLTSDAEDEKEWESVEVEVADKKGSVDVDLEGLTPGSAYTAEVYAANGDIKSEAKSVEFSTSEVLPVPAISNAAVVNEKLTETSAAVKVEFSQADAINYCIYTDAEADKVWESETVEVKDGVEAIELAFEELAENTAYKVDVTASNGEIESKATTVSFSTNAAAAVVEPMILVVNDATDVTESSFSIKVEVKDAVSVKYAIYLQDEAATAERVWSVANVVDNEVVVNFSDLEAETSYTAEFVAVNGEKESQAGYAIVKTSSKVVAGDAKPFKSVTLTEISAFTALLTVDIDEDVCEGWSYMTGSPEYPPYTDYWATNIASGYDYNIQVGDGTFVVGSDYPLLPASEYLVAVAAIVDITTEEQYGAMVTKGALYGEIESYDFATISPVIGESSETITLEPGTITHKSASINATRSSSNVKKCYQGFVKASEVAGGESGIQDWMNESDFFATAYAAEFRVMNYETYTYDEVETIPLNFSNLEEGADYYAFAIPISENGQLGALATVAFTVGTLAFDDNINCTPVVIPGPTSAQVAFPLASCENVYYFNAQVAWYSEDQLKEQLLNKIGNDYDVIKKADFEAGMGTYTFNNLTMTTDYCLATLPIGANGELGKIEYTYYSTTAPSFDSAATIELSMAYGVKDSYGWINGKLNVTLSNGAVSYMYGGLDKAYVTQQTPEAWGTYVLGNWPNSSSDAQVTFGFANKDYMIVLIPVDAAGAYGTPVKFSIDDWDNFVDVPEPTTGGEDQTGGDLDDGFGV